MGSFRKRKSSGTDRVLPAGGGISSSYLDEILDRFSEALAVVETACNALQSVEDEPGCSVVGAELSTLRQGVAALRAVHEEFDIAIKEVGS